MVINTDTHLDTQTAAAVGKMLVEALSGNLTNETVEQIRYLPIDIEAVPQPFKDLMKQAGGSASTGKELTHIVLQEIQGICMELLDPNYPTE